ncbi:MAG: transposase, partial [Deltaproteobacteria bacterium]|nr:transposase [Deltaproteobacteria bacterium]
MNSDAKYPCRRPIRLRDYDYSQNGAYFVTICTHKRECLFGEIVNGEMQLNDIGRVVVDEWLKTPQIRDEIDLDQWVIMPNHFHGIIVINRRGTLQRAPTHEQFGKPTSNSIPTIIRLFKSTVTKRINEFRNTPQQPVWQRNYYEHVIRNEDSLNQIREYIFNNPDQWEFDQENPLVQSRGTLQRA